ncbi:MAG: hypothetical protein HYU69_02070 [Bacteroidetes bacterium]|nr:hypothetical protein [Bacteroidota bacterium]
MDTILKSIEKRGFFIALFLVIAIFISMNAFDSQGPHGGRIEKAENYYIELKNPGKDLYIYLLDGKLKTVNSKGISGEVRLFFRDSTTLNIQLKPTADSAFVAEAISDFYACDISFNVFGKTVSAKFDNPVQVVDKGLKRKGKER